MKNSQDCETFRKSHIQSISPEDSGFAKIQVLFSGHKVTYISCFVVVTFVVCLAQEFTFVLNYATFTRTTPLVSENVAWHNSIEKDLPAEGNWADDWRKITSSIYVYSAFWENRLPNGSFVRVIGGVYKSKPRIDETKCLLKRSGSVNISEASASYRVLLEDHGRLGKAIYIECNASDHAKPGFVSIVPLLWNDTWPLPQWLPVHDANSYANSSRIGLCVRPMYGSVDALRVAEFVAYHEAVGVSQFTFYDYDMPEDVSELLRELGRTRYDIEVLPWSLPRRLGTVWAYGQMASINDCVYRQRAKSMAYTVVADVDEFVTPRKVFTLQELLAKEDVHGGRIPRYGSFVFRSTVFCVEYERDVLPPYIPPFQTQSSIYRQNYIYPVQVRSKYLLKPALVETAGIHFAWSHVGQAESKFVAPAQVLVHHYRSRLCVDKRGKLPKGVIDVRSRKYLNQLLRSRAIQLWREKFSGQSSYWLNHWRQIP